MSFSKSFQVIWADIDANRHMRHSAYYDYAAQMRVMFFSESGYSLEKLAQLNIGPVLFREEAVFLKEIHMNESISVDINLAAMRQDGSRWKIVHNISKSSGEKSAVITVEGAWLDLQKRKLTTPPQELLQAVDQMPKTENFEILPEKKS